MQIVAVTNEIRMIENLWIPMRDGVRLAARIWLPEEAESIPVPVVLEYIPYRKRDLTRIEDNALQTFIAERGIAVARVDIRGTGDSEGVIHDEYTEQELQDALDIIDWLAQQSWSTGKVGMKGISWGGINSLQVAALNPKPLKAIVTYCSTDHRFRTDAHYLGGVLTRSNFDWGALFQSVLALPPDPEVVGSSWKVMWQQRLEQLNCPVTEWLKHPCDDEYWAHGSIDRAYEKIRCPVYAVGGFVDAYTDTVPSLLENLSVPRKGLIGAWGHHYPDRSEPGPSIGFMHEEVRWWNYWLKGIDTGIMEEPMLKVFMGGEAPGKVYPEDVPGRWVAERSWPSERLTGQCYYLSAEGLTEEKGGDVVFSLQADESIGLQKRHFLPMFLHEQLPAQQQADDEKSLTFDGAVLVQGFDILGVPQIRLKLAVDRPVAKIAVRLQEVDEQGVSANVTSGYLNLNLKDGFDNPQPLIPGKPFEVTVDMGFIAHSFSKGNRLRISLSEAYWPKLLPSPEPVCLTLYGNSELLLPIRPSAEDKLLEGLQFPPPLIREDKLTQLEMPDHNCEVTRSDDEVSITECLNSGLYCLDEIGTQVRQINLSRSVVSVAESSANEWLNEYQITLQRDDWDVRVEVGMQLHSEQGNIRLSASCDAYEKDKMIFSKQWVENYSSAITTHRKTG